MQLIIEFDRGQLVFDTDVEPVYEFVAETFLHMLASQVVSSVGRLGFYHGHGGFRLESAESHEFRGVSLEELIPIVKDEVRLQFMRARPDLLWMHAGGVSKHNRAILLAGTSGQGKSTLTTRLCDLGWRFLTDDVSPLRMHEDKVVPFPQRPVRRLSAGRQVPREDLALLAREPVDIPRSLVCKGDQVVGSIVFIEYSHGAGISFEKLDRGRGAMELLKNATNFFDHKSIAVERAVQLTKEVPMFRLRYGEGASAAAWLDVRASTFLATLKSHLVILNAPMVDTAVPELQLTLRNGNSQMSC